MCKKIMVAAAILVLLAGIAAICYYLYGEYCGESPKGTLVKNCFEAEG